MAIQGSCPSTSRCCPVWRASEAAAVRAASKSSPTRRTSAPRRRMASTFAGLAVVAARMSAGTPNARQAYATPWPKFPAEATITARRSPTSPRRARSATASQVPRPLKQPIGLAVSAFTTTDAPARSLSASEMNWGVSRKQAGMAAWLLRIRSALTRTMKGGLSGEVAVPMRLRSPRPRPPAADVRTAGPPYR